MEPYYAQDVLILSQEETSTSHGSRRKKIITLVRYTVSPPCPSNGRGKAVPAPH